MKNKNGFTLIELLMTIFLIGLMSTVVIVNMQALESKQKSKTDTKVINNIETAACSLVEQLNFASLNNGKDRDDCKNNNNCDIPLNLLVNEGLIDEDDNYNSEGIKISEVKNKIIVEVRWITKNLQKEKVCTCKIDGILCKEEE